MPTADLQNYGGQHNSTSSALLTELCKICHIETPKYRCPRCSTRTCSLQCATRHKKWAQCSGLRDPGAYKKRSEIATPSGIDQDYNFISGIERRIERAGRNAEGRGVILREHGNVDKGGPAKGEVNLRQALVNCGVFAEKAPIGMSRQRNNKTCWSKNRKCIDWTVEWVLPDRRKVLGNCPETETLTSAFARVVRTKRVFESVSTPTLESPKKRRKRKQRREVGDTPIDPIENPTVPAQLAPNCTITEGSTEPSMNSTFYLHDPRPGCLEEHLKQAHQVDLHTHDLHLFSKLPDVPFSKVLDGHTVLEFPTIYVFDIGGGPDVEHERAMQGRRLEKLSRDGEEVREVATDLPGKGTGNNTGEELEGLTEKEKSGPEVTATESESKSPISLNERKGKGDD